ncbi:MAG TPA: hypothetical protein VLX30_07040, partial [Burkholderiales bacterium]|nr:hypothetical protein [Burkholderiales bacterium]
RNGLNYPSGVLFRRAAIDGLRFESGWRTTGDIDFYFKVLERGDLGMADFVGCRVTRHPDQAHIQSNLDGTAIREHVQLIQRYVRDSEKARASLRSRFAGMCLALALVRSLSAGTWWSAEVHWKIARELAPLPRAIRGMIELMMGRAMSFAPQPLREIM